MEKSKVTVKENFGMVRDALVASRADASLVEFIEGRIALLDKKTSKRKVNTEAEARAELVFEALEKVGTPVSIKDLVANDKTLVDEEGVAFTSQRMSALLKKLVDAGRVVKTKDGKVTLFSIAD